MWMFSNYEDLCGSYRFTPVNSMQLVDGQSAAPGLGTAFQRTQPAGAAISLNLFLG